ncbi:MAG TPA: Plug domain-containing protein [Polyangium sp.]|nr:Plug domain-containing protein [Polyangium sp.]
MPPNPIIYCETNWIVSLAFPHHQKHKEANELLTKASAGEFELRLPVTALIEAPRPIKDEADSFTGTWNAFRALIQHALANGHNEFDSIFRVVIGGEKTEREAIKKISSEYITKQQSRNVVNMLENSPGVQILNNPNDAIPTFTNIRHKVNFRGAETVDLFILAHVLADRAKEPPERPAILLSLDEKAFDPGRKNCNVDGKFYRDYHLAWCSSFNYQHATARWAEWFATSQ